MRPLVQEVQDSSVLRIVVQNNLDIHDICSCRPGDDKAIVKVLKKEIRIIVIHIYCRIKFTVSSPCDRRTVNNRLCSVSSAVDTVSSR